MEIRFYEEALDRDLQFAVIAARLNGKWLLCRHRERASWELPGGRRELGEDIYATAKRELWEETGATEFQLEAVAAYGVIEEGKPPSFGGLFFAEIRELGERPADSEIGENRIMEELPEDMTYPDIQPALLAHIRVWLEEGNFHDEQEDLFELMF